MLDSFLLQEKRIAAAQTFPPEKIHRKLTAVTFVLLRVYQEKWKLDSTVQFAVWTKQFILPWHLMGSFERLVENLAI